MTCTPDCAAMRLAIEGVERRVAILAAAVKQVDDVLKPCLDAIGKAIQSQNASNQAAAELLANLAKLILRDREEAEAVKAKAVTAC